MKDIELNLTPWSLLDEYGKVGTLSELEQALRADFVSLQALCRTRSEDVDVILCRIFVESFLKFLSAPSYYLCHRDELEVGVDVGSGIDWLKPMVKLYEDLGGTFQGDDVF